MTSSKGCVDDSFSNCVHGQARGWQTVHVVAPDDTRKPESPASKYQISDLEELRDIFPQIFRRQA